MIVVVRSSGLGEEDQPPSQIFVGPDNLRLNGEVPTQPPPDSSKVRGYP